LSVNTIIILIISLGTTIGGTKLDQMPVKEAKQQFRFQFQDKVGSE
jgi:hypothetical protein